jgi:C4-dicarboxylate transporter DctM subunit
MSAIGILLLVMFLLLIIGVPIGSAIGLSVFAMLVFYPVTPYAYFAQYMYTGLDSFTLLALPFFIISGSLMDCGGLSKRLVAVANSFIGNVTGGLGIVTILACMLFGAVSGSAVATVAAIGAIMIPMMVRAGYDKYYATALVVVAGGLGVIVPPSYPMVIYGVTNNVSIGNLFLSGLIPALVVGFLLCVVNYIFSKKHGYKGSGQKVSLKRILVSLKEGIWAIFMPIIILGGIYGGIFTATEASVVATVYSLFVGAVIFKELKLSSLWKAFKDNTAVLGSMMHVMAPAAALSGIFVFLKFPKMVENLFFSVSQELGIIMLIIFGILFLVGMFVQTTPAVVILSPILLSVVSKLGMDPIQFGMVMIIGLAIAFVTPPVAVNLFVGSTLTGLPLDKIVRKSVPFLLVLVVSLFLVAYIPQLSLGIFDILPAK